MRARDLCACELMSGAPYQGALCVMYVVSVDAGSAVCRLTCMAHGVERGVEWKATFVFVPDVNYLEPVVPPQQPHHPL